MGHALKRMAYSPAAQQVEDLGGGLFTADGREICESDTTPMHIGSIPAYIRGFMRRLQGKVDPGDIIIHNNPYHGASHSPDLCVAIPDLLGGRADRLVGVDHPPLRHRWRVPRDRDRRPRRLGGIEDLRLAQALRAWGAQRAAVAVLHRQHAHAELRRGRHGGDDRRRPARRAAPARAAGALRARDRDGLGRGVPRLLRADDACADRARPGRDVGGRRLARRRRAQPRRAAVRAREHHHLGLGHHGRPVEVLRQRRDRLQRAVRWQRPARRSTR